MSALTYLDIVDLPTKQYRRSVRQESGDDCAVTLRTALNRTGAARRGHSARRSAGVERVGLDRVVEVPRQPRRDLLVGGREARIGKVHLHQADVHLG